MRKAAPQSSVEELLRETTSLCAVCKRSVAAAVWRAGDAVVLRKACPAHGTQEALISSDYDWYSRITAQTPALHPPAATRPVEQGCPFDCGACVAHEQRTHLPVVPITSACNLDCPICYTHNKNDGAYHMSAAELSAILEHLAHRTPEQRIINLTGGEPTQHPQFLELLELCQAAGIHRVTVSTHGMHFLKNEEMVQRLAALDARVILSFDSFKNDVNVAMLGGQFERPKMAVLELLEKHGVDTSLLPVLARGYNDDEVADFVELTLHRDFIRSVEFHPMTFTGQSGTSFDRRARYTTVDALRDLEAQTRGAIRVDDFVASPAAHPLCYVVTYLLRLEDGRWLPFPRFMEADDLRRLLSRGLYLEPGPEVEQAMGDIVNRLWAGEIACEETEAVTAALRHLASVMFDPAKSVRERMAAAERHTKAIYVHTHMDEETFDTDRIRQCCVAMPAADGTSIPSCAYNVLYRERDARFTPTPQAPLVELGRGRVD